MGFDWLIAIVPDLRACPINSGQVNFLLKRLALDETHRGSRGGLTGLSGKLGKNFNASQRFITRNKTIESLCQTLAFSYADLPVSNSLLNLHRSEIAPVRYFSIRQGFQELMAWTQQNQVFKFWLL